MLDQLDGNGIYAALRFNELHPPFDDPAARKALLPAVMQSDFMIAIAGEDPRMWRDKVGAFPVGSPLASTVGMQVLTGPRDPNAARAALQAVLTAWQLGETPEDLRAQQPPLYVADEDWLRGCRLTQFQIHPDEQRHGLQLRYTAVLTLIDPKGRALPPRTVVYTIATRPVVSVSREEVARP